MARIFISHSSLDNADAEELKAWLTARGFENAFLDIDKQSGIQPGADWEKTLYREIERAQAVVILVTDHWLQSKWCFAEFTQARALGKAVFPLIVAATGEKIVGEDIQTIDLTSDREGGLDRLSRRLTEIALQSPEGFDLPKDTLPFPGLSAFEERHAAVFYGRDPEIRDLLERLRRARTTSDEKLIAILGASGSGKSSLLRAGLVPRLKRDSDNWIVCPPFRPEGDPLHRLIDTLLLAVRQQAGNDAKISPEQEETWRGELASEAPEAALKEIARTLRRRSGAMDAQILIPIDQAEELFTIAEPAESKAFFYLLDRLLAEHLPFVAVAALRSDHLGELQKADGLSAPYELFPLAPMPLERVGSLVRGPARLVGLKVDDDLISALIRDAESEDALPLIAFLLRKMFETFGSDKVWTLEHYRSFGNKETGDTPLHDAVRRAAEEALPKLSDKDAAHLREAFVPALVRVNAEGSFVRKAARLDGFDGNARPLLEKLVDARLLVSRGAETASSDDGEAEPSAEASETTLEVAHEALFRVWPRLANWLEQEREFLIGKARLDQACRDWQVLDEKTKRKGLLSGVMLERARVWLIEHPGRFRDDEKDFIRASDTEETEDHNRRKRMRRGLFGALIAAVVILMAGAGTSLYFFLQQKEQAQRAENEALEAIKSQRTAIGVLAINQLKKNPVDALKLALASWPMEKKEIIKRPEIIFDGIGAAFRTGLPKVIFEGHLGEVLCLAFSPDGSRILTGSYDNTARLWDAATGVELQRFDAHSDIVTSVAFSSDGTRVLTGSNDDTAQLWDVATGARLRRFDADKSVNTVAFSPDGSRILIGSNDGAIGIWDAGTYKKLHHFNATGKYMIRSAFSPDSKQILTGSLFGTLEIWNAENGEVIQRFNGHKDLITSVTFSSDASNVLSSSKDGSARLWKVKTGREIKKFTLPNIGIDDATFSPSGRRILTASRDGIARLWDIETGEVIQKFEGHSNWANSVTFSPDGSYVLTASKEKTAQLWSATSGVELHKFGEHQAFVESVAFSPDNSSVLAGYYNGVVRLWRIDTGEELTHFERQGLGVFSVAFSPDGRRILTASADRTASIWDAATGEEIQHFKGHKRNVWSASFSSDGSYVVTGSSDGTARLWDSETGEQIRSFEAGAPVNSVSLSPDDKHLLVGCDNKKSIVI